MPMFRCDIEVKSDLILPDGVNETKLADANPEITLRNGPPDAEGHSCTLMASVISEAESIKTARLELRDQLTEYLHLLSFVTKNRFKILGPRRLFEWEAGKGTRTGHFYVANDVRYPSIPALVPKLIETVQAFAKIDLPAYVKRALKCYRYALLDSQSEDQFMQFWLALETIAENTKVKEKVDQFCPDCKAPLHCAECGNQMLRVPMAKQAIEMLIGKNVAPDVAAALSKVLFDARNGIAHGRSRESIEKDCKNKFEAIVEELSRLTWFSIISSIPGEGEGLTFGYPDQVVTDIERLGIAEFTFDYQGDAPHPTEEELPNVEAKFEYMLLNRPQAQG